MVHDPESSFGVAFEVSGMAGTRGCDDSSAASFTNESSGLTSIVGFVGSDLDVVVRKIPESLESNVANGVPPLWRSGECSVCFDGHRDESIYCREDHPGLSFTDFPHERREIARRANDVPDPWIQHGRMIGLRFLFIRCRWRLRDASPHCPETNNANP